LLGLPSFPTRRSSDLFPVIGMVTKDHMLRINHDGSQASLHELYGEDPLKDVASEQPELFQKLSELALAIYESSHYQFYQNRAPEDRKSTRLNSSHVKI